MGEDKDAVKIFSSMLGFILGAPVIFGLYFLLEKLTKNNHCLVYGDCFGVICVLVLVPLFTLTGALIKNYTRFSWIGYVFFGMAFMAFFIAGMSAECSSDELYY